MHRLPYSKYLQLTKARTPCTRMGFFLLCWHLLIVPGRFQPSIVSTSELNCRVRDGNGWTLIAKDTDCFELFIQSFLFKVSLNLVTRTRFELVLPA